MGEHDMSDKDLILAIDNGTQSIRALLFDAQGKLHEKVKVELEPYFSEHPGWAEQKPEYFWDKLCEACQTLMNKRPLAGERLAGVTLTTQRATVVNVNKNGAPLRPAILWLDARRTYGLNPVGGLWGLVFKLIGMNETVDYFQAQAEANWISKHQPDIWNETHKFLLLSGFLTHRLTGRFADSVGSQVGYIPFDYKKLEWAKPSDWKWSALPIQRHHLPDLVPPGEPIGEITNAAAAATSIPEGTPVIAAAADKACEVLGAGCADPHIGCLSYGTTATINTIHRKYVEAIPLIPPYPAAIPDAYALEIQIFRGYWMVSWFKREFGMREKKLAQERGVEPETLFDKLLAEVPPGCLGLTLQPYWSPGVKIPGPEAKGAIIGFGDVHTRAHIYRAILEGLAYGLREGKERTEKRSKINIREVRVAGGGSQSDGAMQLTADIFNLPASRPHLYEASGLGAAIDCAVGLGWYSDFGSAVSEMTHLGTTFEPRREAVEIYDKLYNRVYRKMYKQLKPLYEEIREITGYPEAPR